jgi:hypothetical protein
MAARFMSTSPPLVRIPMLGPVNRLRIAVRVRGVGPRRDCRNGQRHRQNHSEDPFDSMWLKCHDSTPGCASSDLKGESGGHV